MRESESDRLRREVQYIVWRRMTKTAAILGLVNAIMAAVLAFGVDITAEQQFAIIAVVNAILVFVTAFIDPKIPWGRGKDTP